MLLVYTKENSTRLAYVIDVICSYASISYEITSDLQTFELSKDIKLNYSSTGIEGVCTIQPSVVLFDKGLPVYGITKGNFEGEECLAFNEVVDPLASMFYLLSRMEEYQTKKFDKHGRFEAVNSVLTRFDWLQKAMCDRWANAIINLLKQEAGLEIEQTGTAVTMIPTFDIDNAYAYRHKGKIRKSLSVVKDFLKGDFYRIQQRTKVLLGLKKDPYDTYDKITSIAEQGYPVKLFWLLGDYAKFDKNISHKSKMHQKIIRQMAEIVEVGIHPSYKSNLYELHLLHEKERLEKIINKEVINSRQHYLKLNVKETYPIAQSMGIQHDYTMGYAEVAGFRAGTCRPYKWYDLTEEKQTTLTIHPFAYMDGTLNEYLHLSINEAKNCISALYKEVAKVGGDFVFIWHNETIGDYRKWKGWSAVLDYTLNLNKNEQ